MKFSNNISTLYIKGGNLQSISGYTHFSSDAIILLTICGSANLSLNTQIIALERNSLILAPSPSIIRIDNASDDFNAILINMPKDMVATLDFAPQIGNCISNNVSDTIAELVTMIAKNISAAKSLTWQADDFRELAAKQALIAVANSLPKSESNNAQHRVFNQFITLLRKHVRAQHEVQFYASLMDITPKYLNDMVRNYVGMQAKDIISEFVAAMISHELRYTDCSTRELAQRYGFSDKSSIGKFFKKITGLSPQAFRDSFAVI